MAKETHGPGKISDRAGAWLGVAAAAAVVLGLAVAASGFLPAAALAGGLLVAGVTALLLRHPDRGLWLLGAALPYERLGTVPLGFFTLKFGHLIAAGMLGAWAARSALTRSLRLMRDPLRVPLLLLLGASVLSLTAAVNLPRGAALIGQLVIGLLVYLLTINFLSRRTLKGALLAVWAGALVVSLFGLYQFVGDYLGIPPALTGLLPSYSGSQVFGFARIQSVSLEPLYFANYLLLPLLTAAAYFFGTAARRRLWLIPFLALLLTVFILTLARGAYLGLLAGGLLLLAVYWQRILTPRVIAGATFAVGVVVAGVVVLLLQTAATRGEAPLEVFAKQISGTGQDVSSQQRIGSISAARQLVADHPLTGVGVGNFGEYYQDPRTQPSPDRSVSQVVNNQTLETLVETGLVGLFALLLLVWMLLARTIRAFRAVGQDDILRAALVGSGAALAAMLVQAQTFSALYLMHLWFTIGLVVAVQNLILLPKRDQPS